ncbi:hypothetical protein SHKM778_22910 [Streptomyces sp. KM77-8]|uniref:Diaminopimelate epimerase n=1 Tax=Streptomyces haneummycinicus TaxID=3074435 RepID=A0AAT9HEK2_9ACTN
MNVEFVVDRGPRHVALRVHERGSGETRSCGTGACAVAVATARRDGADPAVTGTPVTYTVEVPGGTLVITERPDGEIEMTGPAVIVAEESSNPSGWRTPCADRSTGSVSQPPDRPVVISAGPKRCSPSRPWRTRCPMA